MEQLLQLRPLRADAPEFVPADATAVETAVALPRWRPKERRMGARSRRQRSERRACDAEVLARAAMHEQQSGGAPKADATPRQEGDRVAATSTEDLDLTALASTFFDVSRVIFGRICATPRPLPFNPYFAYRYARTHGLAD